MDLDRLAEKLKKITAIIIHFFVIIVALFIISFFAIDQIFSINGWWSA
jgi:hypothetical protein